MTNEKEAGRSQLARQDPDQIVGRTWADLVVHLELGQKAAHALSQLWDWGAESAPIALDRIRNVCRILSKKLQTGDSSPIPPRIALEVLENVTREEREELHELWAALLASSARGVPIDAFHLDIVRRLDPNSARVFAKFRVNWSVTPSEQLFMMVFDELGLTDEQLEESLARCYALGILVQPDLAKSAMSSFSMSEMITPIGKLLLRVLWDDDRSGE